MFSPVNAKEGRSPAMWIALILILALVGCGSDDDGGTTPPEVDTTPPPMVLDFLAIPGDGQVSLSWAIPTGGDWVGTMVRRDTAAPAGPTSGALVVDTTGQSYVDATVTNDSTYIFAAYSYDLAGNYSEAATATATPHAPFVVGFPDANLAQAMRGLVGIGAGDDITDLDLLPLTELELAGVEIADLTGLQYCVNVVEIDLTGCGIDDDSNLEVLADLPRLADLDLGGADLTTLAPLADLTGLTRLVFESPQVTSLAPLASLTALESLRFGGLAITSLAPLSGLSNLTMLEIGQCDGIDTFADLSGLTQLTFLRAEDIPTDDLTPLATLVNLDVLDVNGCLAQNLDGVVGLTQMSSLSLYRMPLLREAIDVQIPALEAAGVGVYWSAMIPAELVGVWEPVAVTVDGTPADLAEFFEWDAAAETAAMTAYANKDYRYEELDAGGVALYEETGGLFAYDDQLEVTVETENGVDIQDYIAFSGSWQVDGTTLTLTAEEEGSTAVITWQR